MDNIIYQLNITLRDIKPPVWRRIEEPSTATFLPIASVGSSDDGLDGCPSAQF
ncbi:hypothetical protein [Salsuginibacillus kocurii]|uniref:hypothetical protein n=1 Tax=Salsuginibacillus kocurii TaxID=427078 RepID=UPI0003633F44|nr:hypothetical protein [Salsuginibacillus kocurii]